MTDVISGRSYHATHWSAKIPENFRRWDDFIPQSDTLLRNQIAPQCAKDLGITLTIEMINGNDIQARTTAAIQSGAGPDVICALNNWPQLYANSTVDVRDTTEKVGK